MGQFLYENFDLEKDWILGVSVVFGSLGIFIFLSAFFEVFEFNGLRINQKKSKEVDKLRSIIGFILIVISVIGFIFWTNRSSYQPTTTTSAAAASNLIALESLINEYRLDPNNYELREKIENLCDSNNTEVFSKDGNYIFANKDLTLYLNDFIIREGEIKEVILDSTGFNRQGKIDEIYVKQ